MGSPTSQRVGRFHPKSLNLHPQTHLGGESFSHCPTGAVWLEGHPYPHGFASIWVGARAPSRARALQGLVSVEGLRAS